MGDLLNLVAAPESGFMPHGMCYAWKPAVLWLNVGSDIMIFLAYFSIPFALLTFVRRRHDLEFKGMFILFAAFIILCGITHFMSAWVVWNPDYVLHGAWKLATALVSAATAAVLWPTIPKALSLPSPSQMAEANAQLATVNERLEERVAERTAELEANQRELMERNRDLKKRDDEISRLLVTDPLTGVANRRRLEEVLDTEIQRCARHDRESCVAYVDIDDFKTINDRHGHQAGDRVLQEVARAMANHLRANDTIARYGGDEFVLVLPETSSKQVTQLIDRIRGLIGELAVPGISLKPHVSAGIAACQPGETADSILKRADDALYRAKSAGKDRAWLGDGPHA